jgi:hypothetical protein
MSKSFLGLLLLDFFFFNNKNYFLVSPPLPPQPPTTTTPNTSFFLSLSLTLSNSTLYSLSQFIACNSHQCWLANYTFFRAFVAQKEN